MQAIQRSATVSISTASMMTKLLLATVKGREDSVSDGFEKR
jgi:hypothetical protein